MVELKVRERSRISAHNEYARVSSKNNNTRLKCMQSRWLNKINHSKCLKVNRFLLSFVCMVCSLYINASMWSCLCVRAIQCGECVLASNVLNSEQTLYRKDSDSICQNKKNKSFPKTLNRWTGTHFAKLVGSSTVPHAVFVCSNLSFNWIIHCHRGSVSKTIEHLKREIICLGYSIRQSGNSVLYSVHFESLQRYWAVDIFRISHDSMTSSIQHHFILDAKEYQLKFQNDFTLTHCFMVVVSRCHRSFSLQQLIETNLKTKSQKEEQMKWAVHRRAHI